MVAICDHITNAQLEVPFWHLKFEVTICDFKFEARMNGARGGSRTPDILITNQVLYQLSYAGIKQFQTCRPWRRDHAIAQYRPRHPWLGAWRRESSLNSREYSASPN